MGPILVCANITARHDLVIGENAIVGASTLVNKSVPANTTVAGVPAKIIKQENRDGSVKA